MTTTLSQYEHALEEFLPRAVILENIPLILDCYLDADPLAITAATIEIIEGQKLP